MSAALYATGSAKALYSGNSNVLSNPFSLSQFPAPSPGETDPTSETPEETGNNNENPEETKSPEETGTPSETDPDTPGESKDDPGETKDDNNNGSADIPEEEKAPEEIREKGGIAYLISGPEFNQKIRELWGEQQLAQLKYIDKVDKPGKEDTRYIVISTEDSGEMAYLYIDEDIAGRTYIVSDATEIYANKNCSGMFKEFAGIGSPRNVAGYLKTDYVEDMSAMFKDCTEMVGLYGLDQFNVSNVRNVSQMFMGCKDAGGTSSIAEWDTSNIKDMSQMFQDCKGISGASNLRKWNVSNVKNMSGLFRNTGVMSVEELSSWDVSNVRDMSYMFAGANLTAIVSDFVSGFKTWDVSNVETMEGMFLDQSLSHFGFLANWKTDSLKNLDYFFASTKEAAASTLVQDLAGWNVSNVTSMRGAFKGRMYLKYLSTLDAWQLQVNVDMTDAFTESDGNTFPSWYVSTELSDAAA